MNDLAKPELRVFLVAPLNLLVSIFCIRPRCSIKLNAQMLILRHRLDRPKPEFLSNS